MSSTRFYGPAVCLVGVNHDTSPLWVRERLSIPRSRVPDALQALRGYVPSGVILATCNRTEVYAVGDDRQLLQNSIEKFLVDWSGVAREQLSPSFHIAFEYNAIRHVTETASGLRSLIVGEWEIQGQVRQALEEAERERMADLPLRKLFQHAIRVGRRVREDTDISKNALSVSSVAVDMASKATVDIKKCHVLLIGAGQAGKLAARAFAQRGVSRLSVINRSLESAEELAAALGGRAVELGCLRDEIEAADVVISCTGAPHCVLRRELVEDVMKDRQSRPMVIVDIAVPRDVDASVKEIDGVRLYDIDDFIYVSKTHRKAREREIDKAMQIIDEEMERFAERWREMDVKPVVGALMQMADDVRQRQLRLTLKKLPPMSPEEQACLEAMTKSIVNKILHNPIKCLKENGHDDGEMVDAVKELFGLDGKVPQKR
jgi:glutamyl-tRNA reductase